MSNDTRTSMIEIPLSGESVGEYTCTASYHPDTRLDPSPVTGTFTVDIESKYTLPQITLLNIVVYWITSHLTFTSQPVL